MSDEIRFGELTPEGYTEKGTLTRAAILACPHVIIALSHYREDGSCKCDDPNAPEMAGWGYVWSAAQGRWISPDAAA